MDIIYSKHALEQMELRRIPIDIVETVLLRPDKTSMESGKKIFQSVVDFKEEGYYLIRILLMLLLHPMLL